MREWRFRFQVVAWAVLMIVVLLAKAEAAGPVHGSKASAMGTAFVAVADDPSTIAHNAAGIVGLKGTQVYGGHANVIMSSGFSNLAGLNEDTEFQIFFPPHIFLTSDIGRDDIALGLGIYSPFGIGGRMWSSAGLTKYGATRFEIGTFEISPTVAWKPTEKLSVGAGINYMKAANKTEVMVNQTFFDAPDAEMRLDGEGDGWGFNLGALYEATDKLSFGFAYRSGIEVDLVGKAKLLNIAPALQGAFGGNYYETDLKTTMDFPESWSLAAAWRPTGKLTLAFDLEWNMWSSFETAKLDIEREVPAAGFVDRSIPKNWNDVLTLKLGLDYILNEKLSLRSGYSYLPTPVPDSSLEPGHPDSDSHNQRWSRLFGQLSGINKVESHAG